MFLDPVYLLLIVPAFLLGLVAQILVKSRYKKYSKIASRSGMTGAQAAQTVLAQNGVAGVGIGTAAGELTDNYNPQTNIISLSQGVWGANSIAVKDGAKSNYTSYQKHNGCYVMRYSK